MQTRENLRLSLPAMGTMEMVLHQRNDLLLVHSQATEGHVHPSYELYVHVDGDISFAVNDSIYHMRRGDMILTRPNTYHHSICHSECRLMHYCIFLHTTDASLLSILEHLAEQCYLHYEQPIEKEIFSLLERMANALYKPTELSSVAQYSLLFQLLDLLSQDITPSHAHAPYPDNLRGILNYIGKHYAQISSIRTLCGEFYISQATLERLFRQHLQITPYQYIEATRLAAACRLLCAGNSVSAVAAQCGFSDCSHFIALFKRKFGTTPNRYRKENKSI